MDILSPPAPRNPEDEDDGEEDKLYHSDVSSEQYYSSDDDDESFCFDEDAPFGFGSSSSTDEDDPSCMAYCRRAPIHKAGSDALLLQSVHQMTMNHLTMRIKTLLLLTSCTQHARIEISVDPTPR